MFESIKMRGVWFLFFFVVVAAGSSFRIEKSSVHGRGPAATRHIRAGAKVAVGAEIFPFPPHVTRDFGRWVNHCGVSPTASLNPKPDEAGRFWVVALVDIRPGEEITCDYDAPGLSWIVDPSGPDYVEC